MVVERMTGQRPNLAESMRVVYSHVRLPTRTTKEKKSRTAEQSDRFREAGVEAGQGNDWEEVELAGNMRTGSRSMSIDKSN